MLYERLRKRIRDYDMNQADLAQVIGRSGVALSQRLCGKVPWELQEVYAIMDHLDIPYEQMSIYWPKAGLDENMSANGERIPLTVEELFKRLIQGIVTECVQTYAPQKPGISNSLRK